MIPSSGPLEELKSFEWHNTCTKPTGASEHENIVIGIDKTVRRFAHKLCQVSGFLPDEAYAWNVELSCLHQ